MDNLTKILQQGETETIEFKTSFGKAVIETLVAFANTKGGSVYVGVKDSGEIVGAELEKESLQKWTNEIKQKTEPSIIPKLKSITIDNKTIVAIQVQEYPVKPIAVQGKYYHRIKGANHLMNATDIADVYLASMQYSWDSYPYPKAVYADLNEGKISNFIARVNASGRFKLPKKPKEDLKTDSYTASTRNKLIAEAFYLTKDIEKYGSGFMRVRKEIGDYPTMEFRYENRSYGFFSELKYKQQYVGGNIEKELGKELGKELTKNQLNILNLVEQDNRITINELAKKIGISSTAIENNIAKLRKMSILQRIGGRKMGYWEIMDK